MKDQARLEQEEADKAYWNARFRKTNDNDSNRWIPCHLVSRQGLEAELIEQSSGNSRTLRLQMYEVEIRTEGPRGGDNWTDVVLTKEVTREQSKRQPAAKAVSG